MRFIKPIAYLAAFALAICLGEVLTSLHIGERITSLTAKEQPGETPPETYINADDFNLNRPGEETDTVMDSEEVVLDPQETVWNFLGFAKSNQYDLLVSFFDPDVMSDYFYKDYNTISDYNNKLRTFGDALTRSGKLSSFHLQDESAKGENEIKLYLLLIYRDAVEIPLTVTLSSNKDEHGHEEYMIVTPVEDILQQIHE
ncbi:hypothetical protein [Paenibacillus jiagnxiensis]|uniref:hypothetical protein n=1 Tax=Paenibacillus jiagnxiensis TaxID=3228926 RepID=UPI0033A33D82